MKKTSIVVLLALLLSVLAGSAVAAQATGTTVHLSEQNGSGQNGSATLTATADGKLMVVLDITPGAADVAQPAHIHEGTCANLNPKPKYPLTSVMNGKSETTVATTLAELTATPHAINVHKSGPEAAVYVSCADIVAMAAPSYEAVSMVTMNEQNGSGQTGMAHLTTGADGKTMVVLDIKSGATDVAQPAHIHEGTCANLNPKPAYPLTNVVNGKSETTVAVTLADLVAKPYAINVHKSGPEASVYVSCGDIVAMAVPGSNAPAVTVVATNMVTLTQQNGSGQNGMGHLTTGSDGKTMVVLDITPGAAGVPQPAHIHEGTCANLNPKPAYPLTNVVNGKSETSVDVTIEALLAKPYAINVHKSGPEAAVYVSCGDIVAAVAGGGGTTAPGMPTTGGGMEILFLVALAGLILSTISGGILLRRKA
jgi:hypothetical protein